MKASDAIRELMRDPYPDSNIESLYETLRCRLGVILPAIEAAERCAEVLKKYQWDDISGEDYCFVSCENTKAEGHTEDCPVGKALKAYKEASHAS